MWITLFLFIAGSLQTKALWFQVFPHYKSDHPAAEDFAAESLRFFYKKTVLGDMANLC